MFICVDLCVCSFMRVLMRMCVYPGKARLSLQGSPSCLARRIYSTSSVEEVPSPPSPASPVSPVSLSCRTRATAARRWLVMLLLLLPALQLLLLLPVVLVVPPAALLLGGERCCNCGRVRARAARTAGRLMHGVDRLIEESFAV